MGRDCQAESSRYKLHRLVPGKLSSPFVSWLVFKVAGPHFDALVIHDTRCRSHRPLNTIRDYKDTYSIVRKSTFHLLFLLSKSSWVSFQHGIFMEFSARLQTYSVSYASWLCMAIFVILIIVRFDPFEPGIIYDNI